MLPRSVLLVDDHPVVALGLKLALQASERLSLAATRTNPSDGLAAVERLAPDAIVLDLAFDATVHLSMIRDARALLPDAAIVIFTSMPANLYQQDCLAAGANAYLTKDHDLDELIRILEDLCFRDRFDDKAQPVADAKADAAGKKDVAPVRPSPPALAGTAATFTKRESEIAALLSRGLSMPDIAVTTGISQNTVAVHRENLRRKLGCRDSFELIARLARIYADSEKN